MSVVVTTYVIVKGSVYSQDCTVFGLEKADEEQVLSQYPVSGDAMNGIIVKAPSVVVLNLLARAGFKVVSSTGEAETVWTLEARRTVPHSQLHPPQPPLNPQLQPQQPHH